MIETIDAIINDAKERFNHWIGRYEPWEGNNHTTERNLSFQFATAFLRNNPDGLVFMEVPFYIYPSKNNNNHLDAYLHTKDFAFLLECKNIYAPSHIKNIVSDIERLNVNLVEQISRRHKIKFRKSYGVVFAETWYQHIAEWWEDNSSATRNGWAGVSLPIGWNYKTKIIYQNQKKQNETLYWLYGVSEQL